VKLSPTLKWTGLALLGLLVAVAVAIAASNLASRQIGLSSESISAGEALAPAAKPDRGRRSPSSGRGHDRGHDVTAPTTTSPPPEGPPATPTVEPPAGSGDDHGGGHESDD
jgi:hypothetical protein